MQQLKEENRISEENLHVLKYKMVSIRMAK